MLAIDCPRFVPCNFTKTLYLTKLYTLVILSELLRVATGSVSDTFRSHYHVYLINNYHIIQYNEK